jgi:DNA-binding NtrC family response regulator
MTENDPFATMIGNSPELNTTLRSAQIVARTETTVLITGETGTGKELLARALHDASPRSDKPFVAINCAALPEGLIESELFGYRKGAYTGADRNGPGFVRQAEGGTLFLDEIGDLPAAAQARLLRLLEQGEVQPLGDHQTHRVDVRIVVATHQPLYDLVQKGRFRQDLYFRLAVVPLEIPALKHRQGDIPLLARHFIQDIADNLGITPPKFTRQALARLNQHAWPGNVRELRNLCERLCILLPGQTIGPGNLGLGNESSQTESGFRLPSTGIRLESLEQDAIRQALSMAEGNKSRAARLLGISRDTLLYRLKKYQLGC